MRKNTQDNFAEKHVLKLVRAAREAGERISPEERATIVAQATQAFESLEREIIAEQAKFDKIAAKKLNEALKRVKDLAECAPNVVESALFKLHIKKIQDLNLDRERLEARLAMNEMMRDAFLDALKAIHFVVPERIRRLEETIANLKNRPSEVAGIASRGRVAKFKALEKEAIRLYKNGKWKSVPEAAKEITPIIVVMSSNGNGNLAPTTTKPLEWIRAYNKRKKEEEK